MLKQKVNIVTRANPRDSFEKSFEERSIPSKLASVRHGGFQEKNVLSPNITNIIQDQPSSNVQKQPSRVVVKTGKSYSLNV